MTTAHRTDDPGRLDAVVEEVDVDAGWAVLRVDGARLVGRLWPGAEPGRSVPVRVRPEDVVLCTEVPGRVSTRNVLPAEVVGLHPRPEGVLVALDAGLRLHALVTRRTVDELGLRPGRRVVALLKATAVVPVEEVDAPVRVSVVGRHGELDPRKLALLEAIHGAGSLSAAARAVGVSYRTAWLWVDAMNAAWGAPLVETVQGGAGGGGALLTPAAHGVLDLARRRTRPEETT